MNDEQVEKLFKGENAIWFFDHNGDPKAPHAELTSGLCSDGYVNCRVILADPVHAEWLARKLVALAAKRHIKPADWVVGSAYAAITLSFEVARLMGAVHGFTQKDPKDEKKMIWVGPTIPEAASVLQCEELVTTRGTTDKVRKAIEIGNPYPVKFLPDILTIVHRPESISDADMVTIAALIRREVKTWEPAACPLCQAGSQRVRPSKNWAQLMGKK
jgi:orotate phosphoribosyltransferase